MISFIKNTSLNFAKRDPVTNRQDREHSVSILGSSRVIKENAYQREIANLVGKKLAKLDFDVYTGGCTGIAQAANEGAKSVNPITSLAIQVKRFFGEKEKDLTKKGIYENVSFEDSGAERTNKFIDHCNHSILFSGGAGSGQELWVQLEAKAYKWSPDDPSTDDIIVVNDKGYYDSHLNSLENIEAGNYGSNPDKGKAMRDVINKEVKINSDAFQDAERVASEIVRHIVLEANKNSDATDQIKLKENKIA